MTITHHKMGGICLELVDGLELIEPRPGSWEAQLGRQLHETQLGLNVFQLLIVAQRMPVLPAQAQIEQTVSQSCQTNNSHEEVSGLPCPAFGRFGAGRRGQRRHKEACGELREWCHLDRGILR